MNLAINKSPQELQNALAVFVDDFPERFNDNNDNIIKFEYDKSLSVGGNKVESHENILTIFYSTKTSAFRALGRLMGAIQFGGGTTFTETPAFSMIGIMMDCSRNAVMKVASVKNYLRRCALMGINTFMLYTEDTYEVPSEPFFGYLRGGYTQAELRELDAYADMLGIEMFPCIQTLGHMAQFLQWDPAFKYRDTEEVLCAEDDEVYDLVERMIDASSSCFKSKRIHIGMDEAFGLGTGKYKEKYGEKESLEIMNNHLANLRNICKKRGLKPMIWSDMYFRLGSKTHDYYDESWQISDEVINDIPKDVQLVYWDYYHTDEEHYRKFINFHRELGSSPLVGGGIWTWNRLWCGLPYSIKATNACMNACRKENISEVFTTIWGDGGAECNYTSALPGLQHFAELAYADTVAPGLRKSNLVGSCNLDFDSFMKSSEIDTNTIFKDNASSPSEAAKVLLWQDPVFPLAEPVIINFPIHEVYSKLAVELFSASKANEASHCLRHPALIAKIISIKAGLRKKIVRNYKNNDKQNMINLCNTDLRDLEIKVKELWQEHRESWMKINKAFGWEVLESRYGTLIARLDTLRYRLEKWYNGDLSKLEEFEVELQNVWAETHSRLPIFTYSRLKTPSFIK